MKFGLKCKSLTVKRQSIITFTVTMRNTAIDITIHIAIEHKMMIRGTYGTEPPQVQRRPQGVCWYKIANPL